MRKFADHRRERLFSGFTLIELLVVMAVVGLLAGLAFAVVGRARQAGREAECMSNLRALGVGVMTYAADHDGRLLPHSIFDASINANREWCYGYGFQDPQTAFREGILGAYLEDAQKVLTDPTFSFQGDPMEMNGPLGARPANLGFGYNGFFLSRKLTSYGQWEGYPLASVEKPAETVMFATSGEYAGGKVRPYENVWPRTRLQKRVMRSPDGKNVFVCWVGGHVSKVALINFEEYGGIRLGHIEGTEGENLFDRFDGDTGDRN